MFESETFNLLLELFQPFRNLIANFYHYHPYRYAAYIYGIGGLFIIATIPVIIRRIIK